MTMKPRILLVLFWAACLPNSSVNAGEPGVDKELEEEDFDFKAFAIDKKKFPMDPDTPTVWAHLQTQLWYPAITLIL
jgi:hypothetical protein